MKEYLLKMSKWCFVFAMLVGVLACSDDDSVYICHFEDGYSSYATIKADKESKKTSIEILKEVESVWQNSNSILFDEPLLQGNTEGNIAKLVCRENNKALLLGMGRWARTTRRIGQLPMVETV